MKIFLIGYRGTGKTTLGKRLAHRLNLNFMDTDQLIEQYLELSIMDIIKTRGWDKFRQIEKQTLFNTEKDENAIIATGGGIVMDPDNQQFMNQNGFCIWLDADIDTILFRLQSDHANNKSRPALTHKSLLAETDEMLKKRNPLYHHTAHMRIDTRFHPPEEMVDIIERRLKDVWQ